MSHRSIKRLTRASLEALGRQRRLSRLLELAAQETLDILSASASDDMRVLYQWRVAVLSEPEPGPTFRAFRDADADAVVALNQRSFGWHPEQRRWSRDGLRELTSADSFHPEDLMVYEHEGRIVAFFHAWLADEPVPHSAHIEVFAVDTDATGRGLGSQLSAAIISHLRGRGAELIVTYTEATNLPVNLILLRWGGIVHRIERRRGERPLAMPHLQRPEPSTPPPAAPFRDQTPPDQTPPDQTPPDWPSTPPAT